MHCYGKFIGGLRPGEVVRTNEFQQYWRQTFRSLSYPAEDNLWLVYKWDEFTLRSLKNFPGIPQVVMGFDYFRPELRIQKRWKFIRKIMRGCLHVVDSFHRSGYSHGAINSASLWLNTYDQTECDKLAVRINDFGACQKLTELDRDDTRKATLDDWYRLGFVFLELILASSVEDCSGAQIARSRFGKNN